MKKLMSGLESTLSVGYKTALETAHAKNLLSFPLWQLDHRDDALQQLDLVLDMEDQHDNLVTLAKCQKWVDSIPGGFGVVRTDIFIFFVPLLESS